MYVSKLARVIVYHVYSCNIHVTILIGHFYSYFCENGRTCVEDNNCPPADTTRLIKLIVEPRVRHANINEIFRFIIHVLETSDPYLMHFE